jgi:hypothetical protein
MGVFVKVDYFLVNYLMPHGCFLNDTDSYVVCCENVSEVLHQLMVFVVNLVQCCNYATIAQNICYVGGVFCFNEAMCESREGIETF